MKLDEVGKLFDRIVEYYPVFSGDGDKLKAWHDALRGVSYETAKQNLVTFASDPDNKYSPHPGALAKRLDSKSDAERYHEHMQRIGVSTLEQFKHLRQGVSAPNEEHRRKVRELLG